MNSAKRNGYSRRVHEVSDRTRPVADFAGTKSDDSSHHRWLFLSTAFSYGPETSGIQSHKMS